ncbi:MAG TPA: saccharopine dehydrogenase NADP-binding domain-containing protein [Povalibacter sp.]|nr:saccharopine dehydrogenase NADP-binding domain-containing protein [Povalibacter sp.]
MSWLLYGANGYTGELIAREAVRRGMRPILAGRSKQKIGKLAAELGCPSAVFELDDHTALVSSLENVAAVLHCAGPFSATARSMMQACLASHVHYLDITGEIDVFELAHSVHEKAQRSGIVLCPGVGFDVVPTDCVALKLREALPDATHLTLGFDSKSGLSKGTAKTAVESAGEGSRVRRDGKIITVPLASQTRRIDFGNGERLAVGIAWGDVATAYYSTGIPNIEVFTASSQHTITRMRRANLLRPLLRTRLVKGLLKRSIERRLQPPNQAQRESNPSFVWGEARNAAGRKVTARVVTANGYALTIESSLAIMARVQETPYSAGYATPGMLMGADFVSSLPGSSQIRLDA